MKTIVGIKPDFNCRSCSYARAPPLGLASLRIGLLSRCSDFSGERRFLTKYYKPHGTDHRLHNQIRGKTQVSPSCQIIIGYLGMILVSHSYRVRDTRIAPFRAILALLVRYDVGRVRYDVWKGTIYVSLTRYEFDTRIMP